MRGDPLPGVGFGHATVGETGQLSLGVADDEPDLVAPGRVAGLDQLDRLEHDRGWSDGSDGGDGGDGSHHIGGANRSLQHARDGRMDDRLEIGQAIPVGEDEAAQCDTIERAVGAAELGAEAGDHRFAHWGARRHQLARHFVGVDHGRAARRQPAGHGRLAAADRADEADQRGCGPQSATPRDAHGAASSISSQACSTSARA